MTSIKQNSITARTVAISMSFFDAFDQNNLVCNPRNGEPIFHVGIKQKMFRKQCCIWTSHKVWLCLSILTVYLRPLLPSHAKESLCNGNRGRVTLVCIVGLVLGALGIEYN